MPIARLIILAIVVGLLVALYRRLRHFGEKPDKKINYEATVPCHRCGLHVLESEAIRKNDHYYCSAEHAEEE